MTAIMSLDQINHDKYWELYRGTELGRVTKSMERIQNRKSTGKQHENVRICKQDKKNSRRIEY